MLAANVIFITGRLNKGGAIDPATTFCVSKRQRSTWQNIMAVAYHMLNL
jgi:hypothetical protein